MTISPIRVHTPTERAKTKFGMRGRVAAVIICVKFYGNRLRGFRAVRGQNGVFHWLWQSPLQQVSTTVLPVIPQFYLPLTHKLHLPLLPSWKASPTFGWYSLRLAIEENVMKRRRRIYSSSFATTTITTKRYTDRLPGRVYTHQCWPPMTNHM